MRKIGCVVLAGAFLLFLSAGQVLATPNPDTGPGCGIGKKLWEDWKGQKQIAPQMFMASTNVTGSYSFSIASGTSGCTHDGRLWDADRASLFIEMNYASLDEDMARGEGEYLSSLATLMHVPTAAQPEFFVLLQERYRTSPNAHPSDAEEIARWVYQTWSAFPMLNSVSVEASP